VWEFTMLLHQIFYYTHEKEGWGDSSTTLPFQVRQGLGVHRVETGQLHLRPEDYYGTTGVPRKVTGGGGWEAATGGLTRLGENAGKTSGNARGKKGYS